MIIEVLRAIRVHGNAALEGDRVVVLVVGLAGDEHVLAVEGIDAVAAARWQYRHLLHRREQQRGLADRYGVGRRAGRVLALFISHENTDREHEGRV